MSWWWFFFAWEGVCLYIWSLVLHRNIGNSHGFVGKKCIFGYRSSIFLFRLIPIERLMVPRIFFYLISWLYFCIISSLRFFYPTNMQFTLHTVNTDIKKKEKNEKTYQYLWMSVLVVNAAELHKYLRIQTDRKSTSAYAYIYIYIYTVLPGGKPAQINIVLQPIVEYIFAVVACL